MPSQGTVYAWKCCPVAWWRHARRKFGLALEPACWEGLRTQSERHAFINTFSANLPLVIFCACLAQMDESATISTNVQHKWMITVRRPVYRWSLYWCRMMKTPQNCRPTRFRASWGGQFELSYSIVGLRVMQVLGKGRNSAQVMRWPKNLLQCQNFGPKGSGNGSSAIKAFLQLGTNVARGSNFGQGHQVPILSGPSMENFNPLRWTSSHADALSLCITVPNSEYKKLFQIYWVCLRKIFWWHFLGSWTLLLTFLYQLSFYMACVKLIASGP